MSTETHTPKRTEAEIKAALDYCTKEPVHIPGSIQPFGFLIACERDSGRISHYSDNIAAMELPTPEQTSLFECHISDVLGHKLWHSLRNLNRISSTWGRRQAAGIVTVGNTQYSANAFISESYYVVELEKESVEIDVLQAVLREQSFLIEQIQRCTDEQELFDLSVRLLRHVTGFDRVMIYRFDAQWNGEIVAEAKRNSVDSFLGLNFPSWDIPAQARAIMQAIPLRLISDANQKPVALLSDRENRPPLDITPAQTRGISKIHMKYLRNMGSQATMTLSVVLDDHLWGMISFHHCQPKVATQAVRLVLENFQPVFNLKLGLLREAATIDLSRHIDSIQTDIQSALERNEDLPALLHEIGPTVCDTINACGLCIVTGSQTAYSGDLPDIAIVEKLVLSCRENGHDHLAVDNLRELYPDHHKNYGDVAGAFVRVYSDDRALLVFRKHHATQISWAGNPRKDIEHRDGRLQLQPRASFSSFLESIDGKCAPWTPDDRYMITQLWPLLSAAERRSFMHDLTRQQQLMIDELNHRVRNILSLVKSVSHQALKSGGSLESYARALEARIQALAAAHNMGAGSAQAAVSIKQIMAIEAEPYENETGRRVVISGQDLNINADSAPIFALVIHELMTNAAKYGALSVDRGRVSIGISHDDDNVLVDWVEQNGPTITEPQRVGFGTTLIQRAIPYELGGSSKFQFKPSGFSALLSIPLQLFSSGPGIRRDVESDSSTPTRVSFESITGIVLLVEDNFIIADDLRLELEKYGFKNIEVASSEQAALELIANELPVMALLDVNLGQGQTSEQLAIKLLQQQVPIAFVTGYGEQRTVPKPLDSVPVLNKPLVGLELRRVIEQLLQHA